eukprot:2502926-Prymnesium_polylepis.2
MSRARRRSSSAAPRPTRGAPPPAFLRRIDRSRAARRAVEPLELAVSFLDMQRVRARVAVVIPHVVCVIRAVVAQHRPRVPRLAHVTTPPDAQPPPHHAVVVRLADNTATAAAVAGTNRAAVAAPSAVGMCRHAARTVLGHRQSSFRCVLLLLWPCFAFAAAEHREFVQSVVPVREYAAKETARLGRLSFLNAQHLSRVRQRGLLGRRMPAQPPVVELSRVHCASRDSRQRDALEASGIRVALDELKALLRCLPPRRLLPLRQLLRRVRLSAAHCTAHGHCTAARSHFSCILQRSLLGRWKLA